MSVCNSKGLVIDSNTSVYSNDLKLFPLFKVYKKKLKLLILIILTTFFSNSMSLSKLNSKDRFVKKYVNVKSDARPLN